MHIPFNIPTRLFSTVPDTMWADPVDLMLKAYRLSNAPNVGKRQNLSSAFTNKPEVRRQKFFSA